MHVMYAKCLATYLSRYGTCSRWEARSQKQMSCISRKYEPKDTPEAYWIPLTVHCRTCSEELPANGTGLEQGAPSNTSHKKRIDIDRVQLHGSVRSAPPLIQRSPEASNKH